MMLRFDEPVELGGLVMTVSSRCERCGASPAGMITAGLCPACLMALAVDETDLDHDEALSTVAAGPDWPLSAAVPEQAREIPQSIGPYRILGCVAEGGMRVVYKAEQRGPITRYVAVKVVKLGMNTSEVVAR